MTRPTPALLRAYRRTAYAAGGAVARIGRRSLALDALLARHGGRAGAFVGAWNPYSRLMPPGWNRRMGEALRRHARRLPHVPGEGTGQGGTAREGTGRVWREEHLLVVADPRRVAVLGRRFRQAALVVARRGQAARLLPLAGRGGSRDA